MCKLVQIIAHRKSYCTDFELFGVVAQLRITQLLAKSTLLQSLYLNCLNYFRLMTRTFSIPPCTKYRPFTISQKVLSCNLNLLRTKETFNLKKKMTFCHRHAESSWYYFVKSSRTSIACAGAAYCILEIRMKIKSNIRS